MSLLVDTSVWSLALRRDRPQGSPVVDELRRALGGKDIVVTTGLILQELLQGFVPDRAGAQIVERFASMPLVEPDRHDYIAAADLRNACRKGGVQLGTVDALIAQLAIRHDHTLLTADRDFEHAAPHTGLRIWRP
ncbi:PIN domain-containing protein [Microbacterium sp. SSM24]|uniref:type II toxin-antitoxin system VapC family toxin n=1 Tax=Microbacterium sp. SSM24 TaxID=2991714 RepID=UPI00222636CE|nr:PIN domain-containing protein [Microbacterium sp. SSM24]MCW3492270.1 PIN domain-containing protein [Microbacterium sp. SSM24]